VAGQSRGTDAWVGSIDGTTLTYQQAVFSKGRSDIYTYDLVAKTRHKIGSPVSTSRWEYDGNSSGDWIMYARYYRDADRRSSSTTTNTLSCGVSRNIRPCMDPAPGQISGNYVVWEKKRVRHHKLRSCTSSSTTSPRTRRARSPTRTSDASTRGSEPCRHPSTSGGALRLRKERRHPAGAPQQFGDGSSCMLRDGYDVYQPYAVDNGDTTT
jgi:Tol biopolymer transport system component